MRAPARASDRPRDPRPWPLRRYALVQGGRQRPFVDQIASREIDDEGGRLHQCEYRAVNEVFGFVGRACQADNENRLWPAPVRQQAGKICYHAHLYALCAAAGFTPHVVQHASNNEGILGLVACGMGVTVQAQSIRTFARKDVVMIQVDSDVEVPTIAVWRDAPTNTVKERLISHVKALYRTPVRARDAAAPEEAVGNIRSAEAYSAPTTDLPKRP